MRWLIAFVFLSLGYAFAWYALKDIKDPQPEVIGMYLAWASACLAWLIK